MDNKQQLESLREILTNAITNGAKEAYISKDASYLYGFVVMPDDKPLTINTDYFGGWTISYPYIPSRETGSGCQVADAKYAITWERLLDAAKQAPFLAREYKAREYKNADEWCKKCWAIQNGHVEKL